MATRAQGSPMHDRHGKQRPSLVRSGPPPIPSGISPVLSRPQARTTDPPLTEPRAPPPKPRAPHFQLGTVTALRLAPRTKSPAHEVLWAAAGPKWLAPEAHPPGARLTTGGKPLTSGDAPLTSACAQRGVARGQPAEAGGPGAGWRPAAPTCRGPHRTREKTRTKYQRMVFFGTAVTGAPHGKKHQHRFGRSL